MEITVTAEFVFNVDEYVDPSRIESELYGKEVTLDLRDTDLSELFSAPDFVVGFVEDVETVG